MDSKGGEALGELPDDCVAFQTIKRELLTVG